MKNRLLLFSALVLLAAYGPLMKPFVKSPAAFAAIKVWTTASNAILSYVVVNNMRLVHKARSM